MQWMHMYCIATTGVSALLAIFLYRERMIVPDIKRNYISLKRKLRRQDQRLKGISEMESTLSQSIVDIGKRDKETQARLMREIQHMQEIAKRAEDYQSHVSRDMQFIVTWFNGAPVMTWLADKDCNMVAINTLGMIYMGITLEDIESGEWRGRPIEDFVPEKQAHKFREFCARLDKEEFLSEAIAGSGDSVWQAVMFTTKMPGSSDVYYGGFARLLSGIPEGLRMAE